MLASVRKLASLLTPRDKWHAAALVALMLAVGLVELAGVASIFPLMGVIADPTIVQRSSWLKWAYDDFGFTSTNSFLIALSVLMFLIFALRMIGSVLSNYAIVRFANTRAHTLSVRLLGDYLRRPYTWFLSGHTSDMGKSVLLEVDEVIKGSLIPALQLISGVIVAVFIVGLLVYVDPMVALTATGAVTIAYGLIYALIRNRLTTMGRERFKSNRERFRIAQEVLSGIKEVKIGGLEEGYLRRYERASAVLASRKSKLQALRETPRQFLELFAVGGILGLIAILLLRSDGQIQTALPVIAVYGFAALRLLPVLQTIYRDVVTLRFGVAALDLLHEDLARKFESDAPATGEKMHLAKSLELRNVTFRYPDVERPALNGVNLAIDAATTVGFVGTTGAGKSTLVDIILGLLPPQQGAVVVDGTPLDRTNIRAWQRTIGYVPQSIFLSDESVAANIAFGVGPKRIDLAAVERAARMAVLHDFVVGELPDGYQTAIGERGVRLSGGQRQRIAIARALYHDPDVLVLDEATSALDNLTERAVMDAVHNLAHRKTIILIAHRLTTVRECDRIYLLEKGSLVASGTYDELKAGNTTFHAMASAD